MTDFSNFTVDLKMPDENQIENNLKQICATLFKENQLCDVTLSCKDGQIQAHRMILSSVSSYLYKLFTTTPWPNPCSHPLILLRNSRVEDVRAAMEFIYTGTAKNIRKDKLQALMEVGRELECPALIKSIETAVQNCGVAMFRKMVSTSAASITPANRNKSTDSSTSSASPVCKQEVADVHVQPQPCESAYTLSIPKLPRGIRRVEDRSRVNIATNAHVQRTNGINGTLLTTSTQKYSETNANRVHAETFVYTNKDFVGIGNKEFNDTEVHSFNGTETNSLASNPVGPSGPRQLKRKGSNYIEQCNKKKMPAKVDTKMEESDPASCPWCLAVFTNLPLLQKHIKTHVGIDKPKFVCDHCQTKFGRSAHLKRHLRTHTGEKPYQCSICQTRFARQDKLKIHLERHLQNANNAVNWNGSTIIKSSKFSRGLDNNLPLPIKVLIPNQNTTTLNPNCNGGVSHVKTLKKEPSLISPSQYRRDTLNQVTTNLSPSTTITTVAN